MFLRTVAKSLSVFRHQTSFLESKLSSGCMLGDLMRHSKTHSFLAKRPKSSQVFPASDVDTSKILICDVLNSCLRDMNSEESEILYEPFKHSYLIPHTNIMPEFFDSMNYWMKLGDEELKTVKEIVYMLQEGIILLDDVTDGSELRRGFPTTHTIFGSDRCVFTCTSLILTAIKKLHDAKIPKAVEGIYKNLLSYFSALSEETKFKNSGMCPTRREYLRMSMMKMGSLYNLCIDVMQSFSKCDKNFSSFSASLGLYIQIMNDTVNCSSNQLINDKNFAEDISNGMSNYPIVLAVEKGTLESNILLNVMRRKTDSLELKKYCVDLMEKLGAINESKEMELILFRFLLDQIEFLGGNPKLVKVLEKINKWKIDELYPNHPDYHETLSK